MNGITCCFSGLLQEENRGKTYRELHKSIVQMGFNGKYKHFCCKMNEVYNMQPFSRIKSEAPILVKTWSPTRLSLMLYMESEDLQGNEDRDFLKLLFETLPQIKQLEQLVNEAAVKSECGLKNFAKNLLKDYEAVNNAVITTISNGQVEGHVNRIKNIKRKMYGRAGFQLLRKMVLAKSA